ncbi:MAG: glutamate N-acetyltransferase/amino-acid N-acetyltransferase [Hyphomicrobiaceae bacterium]
MIIDPGPVPAAPAGFRFAGVSAGLKKSGKRDVSLIVADEPCVAAAVFTRNRAAAAPVQVAREHIADGRVRAVVINAGNANAVTGRQGLAVARWSCTEVARRIGARPAEVLPCSTGVIGVLLDRDKMSRGIEKAVDSLSPQGFEKAARAMMTSDVFAKWGGETVELSGGPVRIAAMAKGAGMIQPNMATMLAFILTDAVVSRASARRILAGGVREGFNRITVDGDTSTNDTALLLGSGASRIAVAASGKDHDLLAQAVAKQCERLARMMIRDGEGATKMVDVIVEGARTDGEAEQAARAIANSTLLKCALAGADPNWGRVLMAIGNTRVTMRVADVSIYIDDVALARRGALVSDAAMASARKLMKRDAYTLRVRIGRGRGRALVITSDLTVDYVHFNSAYTT